MQVSGYLPLSMALFLNSFNDPLILYHVRKTSYRGMAGTKTAPTEN
jgi:hypothetical protein